MGSGRDRMEKGAATEAGEEGAHRAPGEEGQNVEKVRKDGR